MRSTGNILRMCDNCCRWRQLIYRLRYNMVLVTVDEVNIDWQTPCNLAANAGRDFFLAIRMEKSSGQLRHVFGWP